MKISVEKKFYDPEKFNYQILILKVKITENSDK